MQPPRLLTASEALRLGVVGTARREALTRIPNARRLAELAAAIAIQTVATSPLPVAVLNKASLAA